MGGAAALFFAPGIFSGGSPLGTFFGYFALGGALYTFLSAFWGSFRQVAVTGLWLGTSIMLAKGVWLQDGSNSGRYSYSPPSAGYEDTYIPLIESINALSPSPGRVRTVTVASNEAEPALLESLNPMTYVEEISNRVTGHVDRQIAGATRNLSDSILSYVPASLGIGGGRAVEQTLTFDDTVYGSALGSASGGLPDSVYYARPTSGNMYPIAPGSSGFDSMFGSVSRRFGNFFN